MALEFKTQLAIPPIPTDARRAARVALSLASRIEDAGGLQPAIEAAVDVIINAAPDDASSEIKRLRLIYQDFYTRDELRDLVRHNLDQYGLLQNEA